MMEKENNFWSEIDSFALSESEIEKKNLSKQEIFSVRSHHDSVHGPFLLSDLKDSLQKNPAWRNFSICPFNKNYWIPLGEHPLFDQRKIARKTLLQSLNPENTNIHLNIKGKSSGPYSFKEVEEMVKEGMLMPCDLINPDPKQSIWIRLFEIQYFSSKKNLPDMPGEHILKNTIKEPKNSDLTHKKQTEAIINLAQLEKSIKSRDTSPLSKKPSETNLSETFRSFRSKSSFAITGLALVAMVIAAPLFLPKQEDSPQSYDKVEKKPALTRPKKIAKKPKSLPKKRPTAKAKPRKFFPVQTHKVIPPPPQRVEQPPPLHKEELETPSSYEQTETEQEYNEEDLIEAIESSRQGEKRDPSSLNDDLGEIPGDMEDLKDNFLLEEDIELAPEP